MSENEPTTVGITNKSKLILDRLKTDGYFNEMLDAYKFAVAYALACNAISPPLSNTTTIFNVGSLDRDHQLYDAVKSLRADHDEPVYKTIERLAEWGIQEMGSEADNGDIKFSSIFELISKAGESNKI